MKTIVLIANIVVLCSFSSCANVKQIDRGLLSSRIMQIDPTPEESVFLNEVNSYREAAAGGSAAVGGGCGCN